mmetsp:Transcript_4047/g.11459  ORF Transcript_4047/g.11459 Transcript_4047/m.11459 type:complete len:966 (+) Transcript_4047:250-3147(+)
MGNAVSPNIVLEHEDDGHYKAIVAGNLLCGRVVFKVNEPIIPTNITLVVEGKEKTIANADSDDSDDESVWNDKICFFRKKIELPTMDKAQEDDGGVDEGIYVFPFEVLLPPSLPSTSGYTHDDAGYEIEYTLKLKSNPKRSFANKRNFFVASRHLGEEKVPCLYQPQPIQVDKFGIIGRGFFSMGARVDNTQVGRGEAINIFLACRNEATVPVERVEVKLIQEVQWNAQTQGEDGGEEVLAILDDVTLPGLHRDSIAQYKMVDLDTTEHKESTGYSIYVDLMAKENRVSMIVPTLALDSFTGLKVKVSHYIRVTLVTMSTKGNPSTQIPIKIGHSSRLNGQRGMALSLMPSLPTMPTLPKVLEENAIQMPLSEPKRSKEADKIQNYDKIDHTAKTSKNYNNPSLDSLLHEMAAAVNDFDVVANKVQFIEWAVFLGDLSPDDYGTIIGHVTVDFSQTRVGVFLARHISEGFTCEHCVAAVQNTTMPFRPNMVEALLPFCTDLSDNHELIREQLSEFEQVVITQRTFDEPANLRQADGDQPLPVPSATPDAHEVEFSDDPYGGINPRDEDVCFSDPYHPGTKDFVEVVQKCLKKFENFAYSPPVYKTIRRKLRERRFLIRKENSPWREATKVERIETIGNYFDQEKELYKKRKPKAKKRNGNGNGNNGNWDAAEENEWEQSRRSARDNWDLAMSVHSYHGAEGDGDEESADGSPSKYDICLHSETHPGNAALRRAIKSTLVAHVDSPWSPPVYRAVKAKLKGRRFFIWDIDQGNWREATQSERVDYFGKVFEEQRISYKLEIKKTKKQSQDQADNHDGAASTAAVKKSPKKQKGKQRAAFPTTVPAKNHHNKKKGPKKTAYDGGLMLVEYDSIKSMKFAQPNDIRFNDDDHPGTQALVEAIEELMAEFYETDWSPPIYKAIRRKLRGRRFFVQQGNVWREANQDERLEGCEEYFELERDAHRLRLKS